MALEEYKPGCGKKNGGIERIAIIPATKIVDVVYNFETETFESIELEQNCGFEIYDFKEDSAIYTEKTDYSSGALMVAHNLSFTIEKMDDKSRKAVEEIAGMSEKGVVAVIETANGYKVVVGYSRKFGNQRPLKLVKSFGTTGKQPQDLTGETISIGSVDSQKAVALTGEIPVGA